MTLTTRLIAATLLAAGLGGPVSASAADAPLRIRCEVAWGERTPLVTVYRLDRAAGRVTGEPDSIFTTAGATQRSERMTTVRTIESWTDTELVLRAEHKTNTGGSTTTIRNIIDLKTLATRTLSARVSPSLSFSPSEHKGTCQVVPLEAAPEKG